MMEHDIVFPFLINRFKLMICFRSDFPSFSLSFTKTQWYEISNPDICKNTFSLKNVFRNIFENNDKDVWTHILYIEGICNTFYCCLHHDVLESFIEMFFWKWYKSIFKHLKPTWIHNYLHYFKLTCIHLHKKSKRDLRTNTSPEFACR